MARDRNDQGDVARGQIDQGAAARDRIADGDGPTADALLDDLERSWAASRAATRIVIGIRDLAFHQEVQDFLGRDPKLEIVGAATDADRLIAMLAERSPSVAVVCPSVAHELRHPVLREGGRPLVVVAQEVTVGVLRGAIDAGARAVFAWPQERTELARSLVGFRNTALERAAARATVVGVHGARGGAGATFVATHLAAAFADADRRTALVDLDATFADVTAALGIAGEDVPVRTIEDLVAVVDELSPSHVEDVLFRHERGFDVLLGPPEPHDPPVVAPGLYRGATALLAADRDALVLQLPRALDRVARVGAELCDAVVLVTTLDLFSLYGARRSMSLLSRAVGEGRWWVVVNKPARSALTERDVERVLGVAPRAVIRADSRVPRVQARGQLLGGRLAGAARDVRRLAEQLLHTREALQGEARA